MQVHPTAVPHAETNWPWKIPLRLKRGPIDAYALVDEADYEVLSRERWRVHTRGYAYNTRLMHRVLLGLEPGNPLEGDHINGDKLDNRRSNLRRIAKAHQQQNMKSKTGSSSRYRGVTWDPSRGLWKSRVNIDGHEHFLGRFASEEEAARVAADYRREHFPFSVDR